jgi:hypothetical protein
MGIRENAGTLSLVAKVGANVAREKWGPHVRPQPGSVPPSAESITPEWLTWALCRDVPGAFVSGIGVVGGSDGTSSRRALRVSYSAAGDEAGLPTRLFSKSAATLASRLLLGVTDIAEGESTFYNHVRPGLELRSPRAYYSGFDPRTHRALVLLEDLDERGWTFPDPQQNKVTRSDAEDMVTEMAAYHASLWDSPRFGSDLTTLRVADAWQANLNRKVGFERRTMKGFDRAGEVIPGRLRSRRSELYPAFMRSLALHRESPATLLHQDLHLGNWLRDDTGRMGLYDWQCVAVGNWALDVSYALGAALDTQDRRAWQDDLLRSYVERLADAGVKSAPDFDEARLAYRQQSLHAFAFGLFTYGGSRFEPELQPKDYALAAIGRLARHVDDLETLDSLA